MNNWLWFERPHYIRGKQVNLYYWYWHDYRCRLEPWTPEWQRHAQKWWWVILIKLALGAAIFIWLLLFPFSGSALWVKMVIIAAGVIVVAFYSWLLLHLGGIAMQMIGKPREGSDV